MDRSTRRQFLRASGIAGVAGTAGCLRLGGDSEGTPTETDAATATETTGRPDTEESASAGGSTAADDQATTPDTETLDGLQVWLHPDSETSTTDSGVETWHDDSGNDYDLTQSDSALRPSLVEDAVAGHSALRFDGDDDRLLRRDALGIDDDSARTFVVVSRLTDLSARSPFLMQGTYDSSDADANYYGLEANTYNTAGERFGLYLVSAGKDTETRTNTDYNVHVLQTGDFADLSAMEGSTSYHINGQETSFDDTPGGARNSPFSADSTALGAFPASSPSTLTGELAEVRVYDRTLTESERSSLETSLINEYNINTP
jgi:hypothetical protein